jgi:adenylate kinase family enzyme
MLLGRRRVLVIGSGGAGKSTFARELARQTGLPLIHLDLHYWKPGWVQTPNDEWEQHVRHLSSGDSWIMDGNYGGSLMARVQRCDAIVFFDIARLQCLRGVVQRWFVHQFKPRTDLAPGCPEKLSIDFLRWIWNFPRNSRPTIVAALREAGPEVEVLNVTRRAQARSILRAVAEGRPN